MEHKEDIAVVGIGCNFPGGEGIDNFWKVLLEGRNCAVEIPNERFSSKSWYDPDNSKAGKSRTTKAALIDGFNTFDHKLFGITEAEADRMDPQQKLLLECTYRALEEAGIPTEKASGTRTGVYIGLMNRDHEMILSNSPATINHYNGTGTAMSIAANRISYTFNFTGPSFAIDSACSSSLVALHSACQAIRQGDCEMAICGGVSCIIEPRMFVVLSKANMISPEGTSKPFSSKADGYGRGEGCGIVLLKPLQKAKRDFDHVWGIVCSTAVNQDGRSVTPITKPSMAQQQELLRTIYPAQIDPSHVQYVEAHGTGTPAGDPTEAGSISNVIAKARPPGSPALCVGSVKGNIGHTESAAGVAGLVKVLLMMRHETIVPSLFYSEDNASIDAKALNLKVPTAAEKWVETGPLGRAAGINNFGFGGTNAHAVVKQYRQQQDVRSRTNTAPKLFVLSAATERSLKMIIEDTVQKISNDKTVDLQALAYTSACRRTHLRHKYRRAFVVSSISNLVEQLKSATTKSIAQSKSIPRLVFVFCGNGVTYRGMCKQLLQEECVFREKVKEIDEIFHNYKSMNLLEKLDSDYDNDEYSKPDVVQPLLFAVQVAIASLFKHWGVKADAMVGHSVGEVAAAHCSGLLSLEDAVKVIYFRSTLQATATGGKMLVVSNISVTEILKLLPAYSGKLCLAAYNSPRSCTLSGDPDAIESIHQKLKTSFSSKNLFLHVLDVPAAYHSHMMDPILRPIEENVGMLTQEPMEVELFSTVTGKMCSPGDFITGEYWARNIREPVAFEQAVKSAAKDKRNVVFIEIGPRRALQRNILETLGNEATVFSSVQPDKDHEAMLTVMSKLFELGLQVNWDRLYEGHETIPTPFPRYQFDSLKKEVYFELVRKGNETVSASNHPVLMQTSNDDKEFSCDISSDAASYICEHKNNGVVIVPGAFYVEMGLASFKASVRPKVPLRSLQLTIHFQSPFIVSKNSPEMKVQLEPTHNLTMFKVKSAVATYASGRIECSAERTVEEKKILLDFIFKRCHLVIKSEDVYRTLAQIGFQYGSVFRNLGDVLYGEEFKEALTRVKVPDETLNQLHDYCIHPIVLDYFLQMTAVVAAKGFKTRPGFPSAIGSLTVLEPLEEEMVMYLRTTKANSDYLEVCGCFTNKKGCVLVELKHVRMTFLGNTSSVSEKYLFHNELTTVAEDFNSSNRSVALVFADQLGVAQALRQHLHHNCTYIPFQDSRKFADRELPELISQLHVPGKQYKEVLFLWGIQNLNNLTTEEVLECLVCCCEVYCQIVKTMKEKKSPNLIRAVTYRSTENTVDHITPGFVLSGMTRSCAAEIPSLTFQLIDIGSVSSEDITALAQIINSHTGHRYPEIVISKGQIFTTEITRTTIRNISQYQRKALSSDPECFTLQTANPYKMTGLSASPSTDTEKPSMTQCVEVQMNTMCVHSSDYFPVSLSDLEFGQTIYWSEHASQNHKLLALDFSGKVTAVGSDVSKLKVGDHIVSCYPVVASSKVTIPEAVCYNTKKFPFLVEVPCLSYFILSWEILHCALPRLKQQRKLGIVCTAPESSLLQVLVLAANKSGWVTVAGTQFSGLLQNINRCDAFVFLPPFDADSVAKACSVSSAKDVIVVCDNQLSPSISQKIFPSKNENVHILPLQVFNIFQKAYLKKQKRKIFSWIKSLNLEKKSLHLNRITLGSTDFLHLQGPESYFCCKTVPVIVLAWAPKKIISDIPVLEIEKQLFQQNSVYMVTGGLSGLGFETVKFIAERGGGCIVILSRSAPSAEKRVEITSLQNQFGVSVISLQCDVSVSAHVMKAITDIGQRFPSCPIRGVFHSAVVLHDGLIDILEKSHFEKVLRPKVNGVLNLHYATRNCKLDYFVCYSSITSFIGNSAQTNYAAANSFLDVFCHYRRNLGLSGQSINWGALNLGLLLNQEHLQQFLETKGMMTMEVPEIHECLKHCLLQNNAQQVVCKFSFRNLSNHVLSQNASLRMRLQTLVTEELNNTKVTESQAENTLVSSPDEYVKSLLCEVGNVDLDEMRNDTTLSALGIDSMLAMTLQNRIFQERKMNVPLVKLLDPNATVSSLVLVLQENRETDFQNEGKNNSLRKDDKDEEDEYTQF
uniref:Fatty acid synthase 2 n=1 Tax=Lepisosteus oculatus TaxID=7918 RepID=W5LW07_LEPOC|nr:PREDICTED: phthiocerol/phenolphthiocerol synthesis polyketide synthase type I PpsD-like [Lepisosteus oculatus]XP_015195232.1 PREDICTED: phthiocerol/phenolphthiocerol synthesis polyketide synthase type I PpsD-like [Lepisosteus oculatus]